MQNVRSWRTILYICPHCGDSLYFYYKSRISDKDLIENFYILLNDHKRSCTLYKSPKKIQIDIITELIKPANGDIRSDKYTVNLIF